MEAETVALKFAPSTTEAGSKPKLVVGYLEEKTEKGVGLLLQCI